MKKIQKDVAYFFELETSLHKSEIRKSPEAAAALLADGFIEFGSMGIYLTPVTPISCGFRIGLCGAFVQRLVGNWLDGDRLFEQAVKQLAAAARFAAVEPERELVQIGIQMFEAHSALMSSQQPALEQRDGEVNARHQLRCRFAAAFQEGDPVPITPSFERLIAEPAIGMNDASRFDGVLAAQMTTRGCLKNQAVTRRAILSDPYLTHVWRSDAFVITGASAFSKGSSHLSESPSSARTDPTASLQSSSPPGGSADGLRY